MSDKEFIDKLMTRLENGFFQVNDGPIVFEALKSAAQTHTEKKDILKFLRHHLHVGFESFIQKQKDRQEH